MKTELKRLLEEYGIYVGFTESGVDINFKNTEGKDNFYRILEIGSSKLFLDTDKYSINVNGRERAVTLKKVILIEMVERKIYLYLNDIEGYTNSTLDEIQGLYRSFVRINKSQIVNSQMITAIRPIFNMKLLVDLCDGNTVEVSRTYKGQFLKHIEEEDRYDR